MNSPDSSFFNKRTELFRAPGLRQAARQAGKVVVVEGYFDVTALYQADIKYAAATMGTATTPENLESLFALSKHVVFCFDGDGAGRAAAWKALVACLSALGQSRLVSFMFLPEDLDPDEFIKKEGAEAFRQCMDQARPLSHVMLEHYAQQIKNAPMEKYSALLAEAGEHLSLIKDPIMREAMVAEMAQLFRVPDSVVRRAGKFNLATLSVDLSLPKFLVEKSLLSQLLREPSKVVLLPEDVDLEMPGGNEILLKLRQANYMEPDAGASGIRSNLGVLFSDTPYWNLVSQLLDANGPEENLVQLAQRVELAWITRTMKKEIDRQNGSAVCQQRIAQLAARKFEVLRRAETKKPPLSQSNRGVALAVSGRRE
jgi:DNA primase